MYDPIVGTKYFRAVWAKETRVRNVLHLAPDSRGSMENNFTYLWPCLTLWLCHLMASFASDNILTVKYDEYSSITQSCHTLMTPREGLSLSVHCPLWLDLHGNTALWLTLIAWGLLNTNTTISKVSSCTIYNHLSSIFLQSWWIQHCLWFPTKGVKDSWYTPNKSWFSWGWANAATQILRVSAYLQAQLRWETVQ